jgi:hypothetical protein
VKGTKSSSSKGRRKRVSSSPERSVICEEHTPEKTDPSFPSSPKLDDDEKTPCSDPRYQRRSYDSTRDVLDDGDGLLIMIPKPPREVQTNPEAEFLERLQERHAEKIEAGKLVPSEVLKVVKTELEETPLWEFLEIDARTTLAPEKLKNVGGYYRKLARETRIHREVASIEERDNQLKRLAAAQAAKDDAAEAETKRRHLERYACCNATGHAESGGYCQCKVGQFTREIDDYAKSHPAPAQTEVVR